MDKLITTNELPNFIKQIKSQGTLVLVGGCFDILHDGHIEFLKRAKETGNILIVMLESDENVKRRKGQNRPVNSQEKRAHALSQLSFVDFILLLPTLQTDKEYYEMTNSIEPDIIAVTRNDSALSHKEEQAKQVGGRVIEVIERIPHLSTTDIINKTR